MKNSLLQQIVECVLLEQVGVNKPQPACSTPAVENQEYLTQSDLAVNSQKNTMEFLLINHPLDCPVCDQGGMCELQDQALMHGRVKSRYEQEKESCLRPLHWAIN